MDNLTSTTVDNITTQFSPPAAWDIAIGGTTFFILLQQLVHFIPLVAITVYFYSNTREKSQKLKIDMVTHL